MTIRPDPTEPESGTSKEFLTVTLKLRVDLTRSEAQTMANLALARLITLAADRGVEVASSESYVVPTFGRAN